MTASNLNLAAGRRKLEEFKRKKALALAKKTQTAMSDEKKYEYAEAKLEEAREEIQQLRAELRAAVSSSADDRLADERSAMEREKAAMLGEVVTLRSTVASLEEQLADAKSAVSHNVPIGSAVDETGADASAAEAEARSHAAAIELLRDEIDTMTARAEGLARSLLESQKACDALSEDKEALEEQVRELTVKLAVPSVPLGAPHDLRPEHDVTPEKRPDNESELVALREELETMHGALNAARGELETVRGEFGAARRELESVGASHLAAVERIQELEDQVEESRENIDSLRELLSEGESERVELVSSIEGLKLKHGHIEEQLRGELNAARMETSQWKDRAEKAEAVNESNQASLEISMNAQASPSESALRVRLAKAEAAVEAERQAYYSLEQKSKQWQEALEENASLRQCVTELRENERSMQHYIDSMQQNGVGSQIGTNQQQEARIQEMQAELNESSQTIMRLSGEVNDLVARLKAKEMQTHGPLPGNHVAHGFDHVTIEEPANPDITGDMAPPLPPQDPLGIHVSNASDVQPPDPNPPFELAAPPAPMFPPPPSFSPREPTSEAEAASLFDLIDQGAQPQAHPVESSNQSAPVATMAPPPMTFSVPAPQPMPTPPPAPLPPQETPTLPFDQMSVQPHARSPEQPPPAPAPAQPPSQVPDQNTNLMPWTIPAEGPASGPASSPRPTTTQSPMPTATQSPSHQEKKSVGFWGWIAGADRVVDNST